MELAPQLKVLIVDDEPTMRRLLHRWIEKLTQCELYEAGNGLEALEIISGTQIDMLLTDINMPVLDGVDMISLIKSDPATASMEIAVVSVIAVETKVREILKLGVSDYLLKPLQYDQVIHRLQQIIERAMTKAMKRAAQGSGSETRILVCDADVNFCEFAESALSAEYAVEVSQSVAKTLVFALKWQPHVVLMTDNLSGTKLEFLVSKVKKVSGDEPCKIFALTDSKTPPVELDTIDGTIKKSFVTDGFLSSVRSALGGVESAGGGPLAWTVALEPEIESGVQQTFGMMTGEEPEICDTGPESVDMFGAIAVNSANGDFDMGIELECTQALASGLVAVMLGMEESELEEDMLGGGLNEILNVVAGRIKNSCAQRDIDTQLGLPKSGPERERAIDKVSMEKDYNFVWRGEHHFVLRFVAYAQGSAFDETERFSGDADDDEEGAPVADFPTSEEQPPVEPEPAAKETAADQEEEAPVAEVSA